MRRASRTVGAVLFLLLAVMQHARADSASFEDPRDGGVFDVARVGHSNDGEQATYRIETYDAFRLSDITEITWNFDFDGDGNATDACAVMKQIGTTSILRASFYRDCGQETWATADARVGDRTIEFSLPLIDLVEGGGLRPGADYSYRVVARDASGHEDTAPQDSLAEHVDVPAPTPRPGSAETELGFRGDAGAEAGAGGRGRTAEQARDEGSLDATEAAARAGQPAGEGLAAPRFRFGPIPVCSGSTCIAVALAVPAFAAAVYVLARGVWRRRNRPAKAPSGRFIERPDETGARSHPGHL